MASTGRGVLNPQVSNDADDSPLTATYVRVIVLEAVIVMLLWLFGKYFSA